MANPLPELDVISVFDQGWNILQQRLSPGRLAVTERNAAILMDWCKARYDMQAPTNTAEQIANTLQLAVEARLFDPPNSPTTLDWAVKPSKTFIDTVQQKLTAEFAKKGKARIEKEKLENTQPFSLTDQIEKEKQQKEAEKHEASAQAQIDNLIENFTINGRVPNTTDWDATNQCRTALRGIKINAPGGKYSAALTLKVVQQAFYGETPAAIVRLAQQAVEKMNEAKNTNVQRDSLGGDVKKVGALGGIY